MKRLLLFVLLLVAVHTTHAQIDTTANQILYWLNTGDTTMDVIQRVAKEYLDTAQTPEKDGVAKKFGRWDNFWNTRIGGNEKPKDYYSTMYNYMQTAPLSELSCGMEVIGNS